MKKLWILLPIILASCNTKQEFVSENSTYQPNGLGTPHPTEETTVQDSLINNSPAVQQVLQDGVMREENGNIIRREADAANLPFTVGEEFESENQQLIIKIKNFESEKISVSVIPSDKNMNLRINQITLPNGQSDGPLGREVVGYPISVKGDISIQISKNNMAAGTDRGAFSVKIE